jgi:hypothetical protein
MTRTPAPRASIADHISRAVFASRLAPTPSAGARLHLLVE